MTFENRHRQLPGAGRHRPRSIGARRAFSLIELLVVLSITLILTGLLFPSLRGVRESANRLFCAANMRSMGVALTLWGNDHDDRLPESYFQNQRLFQEMMAATIGELDDYGQHQWDGIGKLIGKHYLDDTRACYCPSHHGAHHIDTLTEQYAVPSGTRIYTNYHYIGHYDDEARRARRLDNRHEFIVIADGMRTVSDFNHGIGTNLLHGDGAVTWLLDDTGFVLNRLPSGEIEDADEQSSTYMAIWEYFVNTTG